MLKSVPLAKWMFTQYPWTWPYLGIGSLQTWSSSDKVILLVHSGCCNKIPRVAYKQQIYFTPFPGLEILDQGASMVRWGCFSLPQTFCKMEPSLPNHLPKVPPPTPSHCTLGFQHTNLGGTQTFGPQHQGTPSVARTQQKLEAGKEDSCLVTLERARTSWGRNFGLPASRTARE